MELGTLRNLVAKFSLELVPVLRSNQRNDDDSMETTNKVYPRLCAELDEGSRRGGVTSRICELHLSTGSDAKAVSQNYTSFLVALSSILRKQLIKENGGLREALICDFN